MCAAAARMRIIYRRHTAFPGPRAPERADNASIFGDKSDPGGRRSLARVSAGAPRARDVPQLSPGAIARDARVSRPRFEEERRRESLDRNLGG